MKRDELIGLKVRLREFDMVPALKLIEVVNATLILLDENEKWRKRFVVIVGSENPDEAADKTVRQINTLTTDIITLRKRVEVYELREERTGLQGWIRSHLTPEGLKRLKQLEKMDLSLPQPPEER